MLFLIEHLSQKPKSLITSIGLLAIILVEIIDYMSGSEINVDVLYILPIFLITWSVGKYAGLLAIVISFITKYIFDFLLILPHPNRFIFYGNNVVYLITFITFCLLTSALAELLEREKLGSRRDFLTGISNRKAFFESVDIEVYRSRRNRQCLTIAYMDCDNFKAVNDQYGHQAGDELLSIVAHTIERNIRAMDLVARLGGDEFAILLPNTGYQTAHQVFSRLQTVLLKQMQLHNWPVTFSIGVATFNVLPNSTDELMHQADELMYSVKANGKGKVRQEVFN